jgi:anti-anti-sigma regulatory factor
MTTPTQPAAPPPAPLTPPAPLALPALLDLTAAEPLCRSLREALGIGPLLLDGAAVERISTPCLQVLASAAATAAVQGLPFRLRAASPVLSAAIAGLGLGAAIPCED